MPPLFVRSAGVTVGGCKAIESLFPSLAPPRSLLTRNLSTAGLGIASDHTALLRLLQVVFGDPLFLISS